MKLDTMSVHELVMAIADNNCDTIEQMNVLESALRRAVVREESVPVFTPEELAYMKREIELHEDYELNVGKASEIK